MPEPQRSPGHLLAAVEHTTQSALAAGALIPFEIAGEAVQGDEWPWRIEWASSLARKDQAGIPKPGAKPAAFNPFLPYDPALFVAGLGQDHVLLINKFPVIFGHVLVVTRDDAEQQARLTRADFDALALAMNEIPGLAFFNGGVDAGASLRHRHLQIAPFPAPLMERLMPSVVPAAAPQQLLQLPFRHALLRFTSPWPQQAEAAGARLYDAYERNLAFCDMAADDDGLLPPYNLLATQDWMLMVPRRRETWETPDGQSVSLNAMSFSGSIFVRDPALIPPVKAAGLMRLLSHVGLPAR